MRSHFRSNVVGYLALVVALSGTSYAAVQLSAGQVQTKHLANNAVTTKKIKNRTVRGLDLKVGVVRNGVIALAKDTDSVTMPPPEMLGTKETFTLPRAGQVYLRYADGGRAVDCTNGAPVAALVLDGAVIPESASFEHPQSAGFGAMELVASVHLSKGQHEVQLGEACLGEGTWNGSLTGYVDPTWTVLLLG